MLRGVALLLALGGCDLVFELPDPRDAKSSDGGLRTRTITFNPQIASPLDDFPISVTFNGDADLMKNARADALDIRFRIDDEQLLHEIEKHDIPTGLFEAWVRIPRLVGPTTTIEMVYGDGIEVQQDPRDVWPNNVSAVWHLAQEGAALDSTRNGITLRTTTTEPELQGGIAGSGRKFAAGDQLCAAISGDDFDPTDMPFSLTLWVFVESNAGTSDTVISRGGGSAGVPGYTFELGSGGWTANVSDSDELVQNNAANSPLTGDWVQLALVLSRGGGGEGLRAYANAVSPTIPGPVGTLGSLTNVNPTCLGSAMQPFQGFVDEIRLYRKALDVDEIATEHRNLADRGAFMQIGDPVVAP